MALDFDPKKGAQNQKDHGRSLAEADGFDFETAIIVEDDRGHYGEQRFFAIGQLRSGKIVALAYTYRNDEVRPISLRNEPRGNAADGTEDEEKPNNTDFPELTDEQLSAMRPAREVMPPEFFETVKRKQGQRGPGKKPAKVFVSIRLDPLVVSTFKASGKNWQRDINDTLVRVVKRRHARAKAS